MSRAETEKELVHYSEKILTAFEKQDKVKTIDITERFKPTDSFYKLGKTPLIYEDSSQFDEANIAKVKQEIENHAFEIHEELLTQFADWGFNLKSLQLMSSS